VFVCSVLEDKRGVLPVGEKGEYSFLSTLVLMAALNEEEGIGPTITELKQYLCTNISKVT